MYKLKDFVTAEMLEKEGFIADVDIDEDDEEVITSYTLSIRSDTVKGMYVPFVTIGFITFAVDDRELLTDFNSACKNEWEKKYNKVIQDLIDKGWIECTH